MTEHSGLVRVSVVSRDRRADFALPGAVPVAELLPELVRAVGALDPQTVHGGYRLVTSEGRVLSSEAGLTFQGVEDGGVLTVAAGVDDEPPRVYDDIVEAMADVVEKDLHPWEPASGRRTALAAAALLLSLGALALGLQRVSLLAAAAAGVISVLLIAGAVVLARVQKEHETATMLGWMAAVYAVTAGIAGAPEGPVLALPAVLAGSGALVVGAIGIVGLVERRSLMLPAVAVGALFAASGAMLWTSGLAPAAVFTVALVVAVIAGSMLPWLSLGSTKTSVEQAHSHTELTAEPKPIDPAAVRNDAQLGHEILLAVTVSVGLLLVLVAPLTVSLGVTGALLAVCCCLILLLRTRQYRVGTEVLVGLLSGLAGLISVTLAIIVLHPDWRPTLAVILGATGAVLLALTLVPSSPSVRRGRVGDIAEGVALVALLPLLVVSIGVIGAVRG